MPSLTPNELKKLHRLVKLFLALGIVGGLLGIIHNIHVRFDPGAERHYGHVTHVHIGGRDFAVPSEYIRGPLPHGQVKQLYVWLTLPDYKPYLGDFSESRNPIPIGYRHVMVLIDDTSFTTDLQFRYNAYRNGPNSIFTPKDTSDLYGLRRTLVYYSTPRSEAPFIKSDLYYIKGPNGNVSTFIDCMPDDSNHSVDQRHNPFCTTHEFQDGLLLYSISYSKVNLPHWRDIETRIHRLIEGFACISATNSKLLTPTNGEKLCPP